MGECADIRVGVRLHDYLPLERETLISFLADYRGRSRYLDT